MEAREVPQAFPPFFLQLDSTDFPRRSLPKGPNGYKKDWLKGWAFPSKNQRSRLGMTLCLSNTAPRAYSVRYGENYFDRILATDDDHHHSYLILDFGRVREPHGEPQRI